MPDFLLELRCEEIPARMQAGARAELEKLFRRELDAAGVTVADITVWSTPRRLALIARGLPDATAAVSEEAKGPPEGAPEAALEGFCRKNGVTKDRLQLRAVKGRQTWFAVVERAGRATKDVLADAIPAIIRDFAWPKSMRWGAASLSTESPRWIRPLSGIVAILGEELVDCEVAGITSGYATLGHRFHHAGVSQEKVGTGFSGGDATHKQLAITIGGAADYAEKLRACHVFVDHEERAALIREGATRAASEAGLTLVPDEGLVVENAGLTEWPVPLLGRFDEAFLDVPPEVIQLTARVNQKYFVCTAPPLPLAGGAGGGRASAPPLQDRPAPNPSRKREGDALANAFVCTANIAAEDGGGRIVEGNRKVLAARLSDARFFWEQDRKTSLADHAKKLERITFHEKLGTVADKVERVAKLARWLVESDIVTPDLIRGPASSGAALEEKRDPGSGAGVTKEQLAQLAEDAAKLCKADLVTEMVGEFPELQGVMGGYYARAEGLPAAVADAIRDHYKPVGQGDEVPTAPVTVAVSLADKLDTLSAFFRVSELPSGSRDPFALRRAGLAALSLINRNKLRISLRRVLTESMLFQMFQGFREKYADEAGLDIIVRRTAGMDAAARLKLYEEFKKAKLSGTFNERVPAEQEILAAVDQLLLFLADRLKVQQREAGVRHDLIDAVFALGGEDDLVRLLARVKALQHYIETAEGADLLAAYKRAANILKKEDWHGREGEIAQTGEEDPLALVDDPDMKAVVDARMVQKRENSLSYTPEPAETALIAALDSAEPAAVRAVEAEDFAAAMSALASLRAPIDRFFDEVTVNDPDQDKRAARLDLLARFRDAVHRVADFGRIEG